VNSWTQHFKIRLKFRGGEIYIYIYTYTYIQLLRLQLLRLQLLYIYIYIQLIQKRYIYIWLCAIPAIWLFQLRLSPEQSGKVEYECERLLGIANKSINEWIYSQQRFPAAFRARIRLLRFARGTTSIEIAVYMYPTIYIYIYIFSVFYAWYCIDAAIVSMRKYERTAASRHANSDGDRRNFYSNFTKKLRKDIMILVRDFQSLTNKRRAFLHKHLLLLICLRPGPAWVLLKCTG
jgi:hypothetical protein